MNHAPRWTFALAIASLGACPAVAQDQAIDWDSSEILEHFPDLEYHPSRVLVKFVDGTPEEVREDVRRLIGGRTLRTYDIVPGLELMATSLTVDDTIWALQALPSVEFVERDLVVHTTGIPNDSLFSIQWGMRNFGQSINGISGVVNADIDADEAWDLATGDANFVIAVVDTGSHWTHPDLNDNIWANTDEIANNGIDDDGNGYIDDVRGWDFYNHDNDPSGGSHGTHTAGTIGAEGNNGQGVAGVMWDCQIMPLRFLGPQGGLIGDAIAAINYAVNNGAKLSNHSWGGYGFSSSLSIAISAARNAGHLLVCASGNDNNNNDSIPFYPASHTQDNVISVAATTNRDFRAGFSNYGANSVDLGGPGQDIVSTWSTTQYAYSSGTSMAAPHVTGVAALLWSQNPGWTYLEVRQRLFDTVRPISGLNGRCTTGGVVNAFDALSGTGGGAQAATLDNIRMINGTIQSGGLPQIENSDNQDFVVDAVQQGGGFRVDFVVKGTSPFSTISQLDVTVEGATTNPRCSMHAWALNWNNNRWVYLGSALVDTNDYVLSFPNISTPERFVRGNGSIQVRIRMFGQADFDGQFDHVEMMVHE